MKKNQKILYVMHINWFWIKQRPHVIAEGLSDQYDVHLRYPILYKSRLKSAEAPPTFQHRAFFKLPDRLIALGSMWSSLNALVTSLQLLIVAHRIQPDIIWLTHPSFYQLVKFKPKRSRVVYDCMDDHLAFHPTHSASLRDVESALFDRADLSFFSSLSLKVRKQSQAPVKRAVIVNNGCADALIARFDDMVGKRPPARNVFILGYFGTVADWFDWNLIERILAISGEIEIHIAGPVERTLPTVDRVHYLGILRHDELTKFSENCDALFMPFVINALIEVVDPVKLYEYISFHKPSLAPAYSETKRFVPFVTTYNDHDDAVAIVSHMVIQPEAFLPDRRAALTFIKANSWGARVDSISRNLKTFCPRVAE